MPPRPKKRPPPPVKPNTDTLSPEKTDQDKLINTIRTIQGVMENVLGGTFPVTPGQLIDVAGMFHCQMHLKKVTPRWYLEHMDASTELLSLACQIKAESKLATYEGIPEKLKKEMGEAIEATTKEINTLRAKMLADVKLLGEIPPPGTPIH